MAASLERAVSSNAQGRELAAFYRARDYRPVWISPRGGVRPEALALLNELSMAGQEGLDPQDYQTATLRSAITAGGGPIGDDIKIELALTKALVDFLHDLRTPPAGAGMIYTDPAMDRPARSSWVTEAALAPDLGAYLGDLRKMNPVYVRLRQGLALYRARWMGLPSLPVPAEAAQGWKGCGPSADALRARLGLAQGCFDRGLTETVRAFQRAHGLAATGRVDPATLEALNTPPEVYERLILTNLDRARGLPVNPGPRFILVDAASARLWLYENGQPVKTMRVIVGSREFPTPQMAGVVRYVIFDPYWNLPPDIVRERVAKRVLQSGVSVLDAQNMEVLSGWSARAVRVDPAEVDWPAVASGRQLLRVRQRPGPDNMMGAMKFMLPNPLGIYLHDTPDRELFDARERAFSAGCVRVEDAAQLARWLLADAAPSAPNAAGPERRVDLRSPVPIYITYLTASPGLDEPVFRRDLYDRDRRLLAERAPLSAKAIAPTKLVSANGSRTPARLSHPGRD